MTPEGEIFPYFGGGVTVGPGAAWTWSPNDPIPGTGPAVSVGVGGLGGQFGFTQPNPDPSVPTGPGSFFIEGGLMTPGASVMVIHVFEPFESSSGGSGPTQPYTAPYSGLSYDLGADDWSSYSGYGGTGIESYYGSGATK